MKYSARQFGHCAAFRWVRLRSLGALVALGCWVALSGLARGQSREVQAAEAGPANQTAVGNFYERMTAVAIRKVANYPDGPVVRISGRVVDETSTGVRDAVVVLTSPLLAKEAVPVQPTQDNDVIARTRTNEQGEYSFAELRLPDSVQPGKEATRNSSLLAQVIAADKTGRMNWTTINFKNPPLDPEAIIEPVSDVVLGSSQNLSGVVLDSQDTPVASALVRIPALIEYTANKIDRGIRGVAFCSDLCFQTTSDEHGKFEIANVPKGLSALIKLQHPEFAETDAQVLTSADATRPPSNYIQPVLNPLQESPATLHLDELLLIRGTVVNRKHETLAGVIVRCPSQSTETTTDHAGKFEISIEKSLIRDDGQPTVSPIQLVWDDTADYVTSWPSLSREQLSKGEQVTIVATDVVVLNGVVLATDDQQPIAELPIQISSFENQSQGSARPLQTDQQGRFRAKLTQGHWIVTCGPKPGFDLPQASKTGRSEHGLIPQSQRMVDLVDGTQSDVTILIDRTPKTSVRVVDQQGNPLVGAKTRWCKLLPNGRLERIASQDAVPDGITDSDGRIECHLPSLFNETWVITACFPPDKPTSFGIMQVRPERSESQLTLVPGIPAGGRVLLDGNPLAQVHVRLSHPSSRFVKDDPAHDYLWESTTSTDKTGRYELFRPDFSQRFRGVAMGPMNVRVTSLPEFTALTRPTVPLSLRDDSEIDFKALSAKGEISGNVVDQNGSPVAGATIQIQTHYLLGDPSKQGIATTDETGAFRWTGLPSGKFRPTVTVNAVPYQLRDAIETGSKDATVVVTLP